MLRNAANQRYGFKALQADGTPVTAGVTGRRRLDGAAAANATGTLTHIETGWWEYSSSAADTDADHVLLSFTGGSSVGVAMTFDTRIDTLTNTNLDATVSSRSTFNPATDTVANVTTTANVTTNNDKTGYSLSAAGVDAIWDEPQAGHTTAGTFGKFLDVEVSSVSGGGGLTEQNVRDAMKLAPTGGAPAAGSVDIHLDDIQAKTDQMNFTGDDIQSVASNMRGTDGAVTSLAGIALEATSQSIKATTDQFSFTGGYVDAHVQTSEAVVQSTQAKVVWDFLETGIVAAGSIGLKLKNNIDAAITTRQPSGAVDLNADQSGVTIGTVTTVTGTVSADLVNDAIKAATIQADAANKLSDFTLRRNSANARAASHAGLDGISFRSPLGAVSKLTNKVDVVGANFVTYQENDTTAFGTQAITTDAAAEPIKTLDTLG